MQSGGVDIFIYYISAQLPTPSIKFESKYDSATLIFDSGDFWYHGVTGEDTSDLQQDPGSRISVGRRTKGSKRNLQKKTSGIVRTQCPILYTWFIFLSDERWRYSFSWCENLCHIRSWFVTTCWVVSCHHQTHSEQTRQASALLATKFHPSGSILSLFWMPLPKWSSDDNS